MHSLKLLDKTGASKTRPQPPTGMLLAFLAALLLVCLPGPLTAAEPIVQLELVTEQGFPITGAQRWMQALQDVGAVGMRIRSGNPGDRAEIKKEGSDTSPIYYVVGILTARNQLALPGKTFSISDRRGIAAWIDQLKDSGSEGVTTRPAAFGLTGKQIVAVHEALTVPVTFSTKGKPVIEVARGISKLVSLKFTVDASAKRALAGQETVADELQGMSAGAALAAAIRPLGLVMAPIKPRGQEPQLRIGDVRDIKETWPIGWTPGKPPGKTLPKLFEFLTVEIEDYTLIEALDVLRKRIDAPLLMDYNAMARHEIDPAAIKVSFPKSRSFYKKIIDRLLYQAKLKSELRVDESGSAFLWITTIKK